MPSLPYWLFPGDDRPPREIDDEITEELQLHLDLLAEERMRQGVAPEEARRAAAERFGDFSTLVRRCRREKQGDLPMLKRLQAVLIAALVVAVAFIGWQQWLMGAMVSANQGKIRESLASVKQDLMAIRSSVVEEPTFPDGIGFDGGAVDETAPESVLAKLELSVSDPDGTPIEDAKAAVLYSISNGSSLCTELGATDADGCLRTAIAVLKRGDYQGVNLVCVAPGFGIHASVMTIDLGGEISTEEITLEPATSFRLRVVNADGQPIRRLSVIPLGRTNLSDKRFDVPDQLIRNAASRRANAPDMALWKQADKDGEVLIDWFAPNDLARVLLKERGKTIESATTAEFDVPKDPSQTVVVSLDELTTVDLFGGGYGGFGGEYNPPARYSVRVVNKQSSESSVTWTPPDNPDPNLIRREAQADAKAKRYEVALAKHVWYHENATTIEPSLSAVRLSFALSEWYDLGCLYPPAMEKLTSIRDALEQRIDDGEDLGSKFHDLAAINKTLNEPGRTVASFRTLDSQNRRAARRAFHFARDALISERAFDLYNEYPDSETEYERLEEMIDRAPDDDRVADTLKRLFRDRVVELVAVLVTTEKPTEAVKVADLARAKDDDAAFLEELDAALRDGLPAR